LGESCLVVLLIIGLALSQDMVSHVEINAIWSQRESASMSLAVMRVPTHANVVVEDRRARPTSPASSRACYHTAQVDPKSIACVYQPEYRQLRAVSKRTGGRHQTYCIIRCFY
jgi:hypothetical protein